MSTSRASASGRPVYEIAVAGKHLGPGTTSRLVRAVRAALQRERCRKAVVSLAVVDDATIAELHSRYLGLAGPTDVMSFDLRDRPKGSCGRRGGEVDGEVVVSMETARRQARRRRIPAEQELLRYAVHGTLHLLGHRDDRPDRAAAMHRIEDEVLRESEPRRDQNAKRRKASRPASVSRVVAGRSRGGARAGRYRFR